LGWPQSTWRIRRQWFILLHVEGRRVYGDAQDVDKEVRAMNIASMAI